MDRSRQVQSLRKFFDEAEGSIERAKSDRDKEYAQHLKLLEKVYGNDVELFKEIKASADDLHHALLERYDELVRMIQEGAAEILVMVSLERGVS